MVAKQTPCCQIPRHSEGSDVEKERTVDRELNAVRRPAHDVDAQDLDAVLEALQTKQVRRDVELDRVERDLADAQVRDGLRLPDEQELFALAVRQVEIWCREEPRWSAHLDAEGGEDALKAENSG